jgi:ABC-type uncharacterized transport system ATPase subunit
MRNYSIVPISDADRTPDNNLTEEATARAVREVGRYLRAVGVVNIRRIAEQLNVMPGTAKKIVEKVHEKWREEEADQIEAQIQWIDGQLEELEEKKDEMVRFGEGERNAISHVEYIRTKQALFEQRNKLASVKAGLASQTDANEVYMAMFKRVSPRTKLMLENDDRETSQQDN